MQVVEEAEDGAAGFSLRGQTSTPATSVPTGSDPTTQKISVKVIDGAIRNALVFLDLNNNGELDADEPSARTDAAGEAMLDVSPTDVENAPVVAHVGTDAVDADSGPVPVAFRLSAPAGRNSVVSPLTTVVQRIVRDGGVTVDQAEASARGQVGVSVSLFSDFTADSSAASRSAGVYARLLVMVMQQQLEQLAGLRGRPDLGGATITDDDLSAAVQRSVLNMLASIGAAAQNGGIRSECAAGVGTAACETALRPYSSAIATYSGLTAASAPSLIAAARTPDASSADSSGSRASASITFLKFVDANYWFYGGYLATAQEDVPNASGLVRFSVTLSWGSCSMAGFKATCSSRIHRKRCTGPAALGRNASPQRKA